MEWRYNRFGHVEVGGQYLQCDSDIDAFFEGLGFRTEDIEIGESGTVPDWLESEMAGGV